MPICSNSSSRKCSLLGQPKQTYARKMAVIRSESKHLKRLAKGKAAVITSGGLRYLNRGDYVHEVEVKPKRPTKPRQVNDPKHVAAARDLRDKYLEQLNAHRALPSAYGKYDVSRQLEAPQATPTPLLEAACSFPSGRSLRAQIRSSRKVFEHPPSRTLAHNEALAAAMRWEAIHADTRDVAPALR